MARTKQTARIEASKKGGKGISRSLAAATSSKPRRTPATKVPRLATAKPVIVKDRKKHKWHPGTVALRDIRRYQKSIDLVIPKATMRRLTKKFISQYATDDLRLAAVAGEVVHHATEAFGIMMMEDAMLNQVNAKKQTLKPYHMHRSMSSFNRFRSPGSTMYFDVSKTEYPGRAETMKRMVQAKMEISRKLPQVRRRNPPKPKKPVVEVEEPVADDTQPADEKAQDEEKAQDDEPEVEENKDEDAAALSEEAQPQEE